VQTNCSHNFNKRFLFVVVVATIVATLAFVLAFAFALALVLLFVVLALIFVSLASTLISLVFLISLSFVVILLASFALFNLLFDRNIERTCELKKIKTKLTIYNSCLMLSLYVCSQAKSLRYISFNNKLPY